VKKAAPILLALCFVALGSCGGAEKGIPEASPDQVTMAEPAVKISEAAAKYVTLDKADVQAESDKFTVKVTLKAAAEIPWNQVFVLYDVTNEGGKSTGMISGNFKGIRGPVSAGTPIEFTETIFREKPAGKRVIVIREVTQNNPAP